MFVVIEVQYYTFPHSDPSLLFISKAHDMPFSHIRNFKTWTQFFVVVSNEGLPILVTRVYKTTDRT